MKIIFDHGIPGFTELTEFVLKEVPGKSCFIWLQSVQKPEVAFLLTDPFVFYPDYEFRLPDSIKNTLRIESQQDVSVYVIVRIPANEKEKEVTANLLAPVIINNKCKLGCQLILEKSPYSIRQQLFMLPSSGEREGAL